MFRVPKQRYRKGQTYALERPNGVILIDCVHEKSTAALTRLLDGRKVLAVLLTHGDLLQQARLPVDKLSVELGGAPILIHEADAGASGAQALQASSDLLRELGIRYWEIPGHTPGSVLYLSVEEKYAFVGDGLVGVAYDDERASALPTHPPIPEEDWPAFVLGWAKLPPPTAAILPLHGMPLFGEDSIVLAREAATSQGNVMT